MGSSQATTFIAVYRGRTASDARLVAVTADPNVVTTVVEGLLAGANEGSGDDPVVGAIDRARRQALRLIREQLRHADGDDPGFGLQP